MDGQQQHSEPSGGLAFNPGYLKTTPGILKIVQIVVGLLCIILANGINTSVTGFFQFALIFTFVVSIVWLVVHLICLNVALRNLPVNWLLLELIDAAIQTLLLGIASLVFVCVLGLSTSSRPGFARNMSAGVFAVINTMAYAAGFFLLYLRYRQN